MDLFDNRNRQRDLTLHAKTVDIVRPHLQRHRGSRRHRLRRIIINQSGGVLGDADAIDNSALGNFIDSIAEAERSVTFDLSGDRCDRSIAKLPLRLPCAEPQNTADVQILQHHTLFNDQVS